MGALQTKAKQVIQDLQAWSAAPGPNQLGYDPASLEATSLLAADVLPWQRQSLSASLLTVKRAELKELAERRLRCSEEYKILKREAADMVLFYEHYGSQVDSQISDLQSADKHISSLPGEWHADTAVAAYRSGATAILLRKLKHLRAMREAASVLLVRLEQEHLEMPASTSDDEGAFGDAEDDGGQEGPVIGEESGGGGEEDYEGVDGQVNDVFFDAQSMDIDG